MPSIRDYLDILAASTLRERDDAAATAARFETEKWTRQTLERHGIRATVQHGVVLVAAEDQQAAKAALNQNHALVVKLPVEIAN